MLAGGAEALRLLAVTEGILLDPVYTAKAMAGLIADVHHERIEPDDVVVFIHTGGTPAVFAYAEEVLAEYKTTATPEVGCAATRSPRSGGAERHGFSAANAFRSAAARLRVAAPRRG